jgi:hypothetical protein
MNQQRGQMAKKYTCQQCGASFSKQAGEVFNISSTFWRNNIPIYSMKNYNGEEITGTFYQSKLQKIDIKDNELWKIEKILKTKGKIHYLVCLWSSISSELVHESIIYVTNSTTSHTIVCYDPFLWFSISFQFSS